MAIAMIALSASAHAESVVFSGAEGSSNSSYAYLGTVIPMEGEQLGRGWYRKAVISMIRYRFQSTERGAAEDVNGRTTGIEGGFGQPLAIAISGSALSSRVMKGLATYSP